VVADTIVTTVGVVIVAWIGYRQEAVRRELSRFNGTVTDKLDDIHSNLLDNPTSQQVLERQRQQAQQLDQLDDAPPHR
jgi:hypothetical protein